MAKVGEEREEFQKAIGPIGGSMPWLKAVERKRYRVKVFKSGNSMAVRLPAGLGLQPGTEMELTSENGGFLTLEPAERPKRKFNVEKVWGSATGLELIKPEDRVFAERPLLWEEREADER